MDNFTDIVLDYITDGDVPENFTDTVRDYLEAMFEGVEGLILDDLNVTVNGTYIPASGHAYRRVDVDVESPSIDLISLNVTENGEYAPPVGKAYNSVVAAVPNTYLASDEGKVVSGGSLVSQTSHATVTENGTIDTTLNNSVTINVPSGGGSGETLLESGTYTFTDSGDNKMRIPVTFSGTATRAFVTAREIPSGVSRTFLWLNGNLTFTDPVGSFSLTTITRKVAANGNLTSDANASLTIENGEIVCSAAFGAYYPASVTYEWYVWGYNT